MGQEQVNPLEQRTGYAVKRLQLALRIAVDEALATGLSMAQFAALSVLVQTGPIGAAELARLCFITRQSMQDVLKSLRSGELVENVTSTTPGRTTKLASTAAGEVALKEAIVRVEAVERRMLRGLTSAEQADFLAILNACAENLKESSDAEDDVPDAHDP